MPDGFGDVSVVDGHFSSLYSCRSRCFRCSNLFDDVLHFPRLPTAETEVYTGGGLGIAAPPPLPLELGEKSEGWGGQGFCMTEPTLSHPIGVARYVAVLPLHHEITIWQLPDDRINCWRPLHPDCYKCVSVWCVFIKHRRCANPSLGDGTAYDLRSCNRFLPSMRISRRLDNRWLRNIGDGW